VTWGKVEKFGGSICFVLFFLSLSLYILFCIVICLSFYFSFLYLGIFTVWYDLFLFFCFAILSFLKMSLIEKKHSDFLFLSIWYLCLCKFIWMISIFFNLSNCYYLYLFLYLHFCIVKHFYRPVFLRFQKFVLLRIAFIFTSHYFTQSYKILNRQNISFLRFNSSHLSY
jgi:hypothetical protein